MLPAGHQELVVADVPDDQVALRLVRPVLAVKLPVASLPHAHTGAVITRELVRLTHTGETCMVRWLFVILFLVHCTCNEMVLLVHCDRSTLSTECFIEASRLT